MEKGFALSACHGAGSPLTSSSKNARIQEMIKDVWHGLAWLVLFTLLYGLVTYQSKKTKKRMKKISSIPQMKRCGKVIGGCYGGGYLIVFLYACYQLSVEHDGWLFLGRMAMGGAIISCVAESMMHLFSRQSSIPVRDIIWSAACETKSSPLLIHFFRMAGPMLLLAYGIAQAIRYAA